VATDKILLGFEVGTGEPVYIKLHHLVITGMTQLSGKTTTIEALIHRSGLRAVVFKTKRGEKGFETAGRTLPLYFKERSDWRYVSSLIEATLREKVKFERSWVIRACKGTRTLREVYKRVSEFLESKKLRALDKSVFTNLQAYLELILPEIEKLPTTNIIEIGPGVNVMDLEEIYHRPEVQALIIRSVMEHILEKERNIIIVVPECWKFLPQGRNTPVKVFFERFIREGAAIGNFLWLDSQDIASVDKTPLRQVDNWILGRQREEHEVQRTIDAIPLPKGQKPTTLEIRQLSLGHFYAACGDQVKLVYVLPAGIPEETGRQVARGEISPGEVAKRLEELRLCRGIEDMWKERYELLKADYDKAKKELDVVLENMKKLEKKVEDLKHFEEWKAKYGGKQIKKLKAECTKAKEQLTILNELKAVLAKIFPAPQVQTPPKTPLPSEISVVTEQPTLTVKVVRKPLTLNVDSLEGRIAIIYAEGMLPNDKWFTVTDVYRAMRSHGWPRDPRTSKMLDQFCRWRFFEKRYAGKRPEYRLKISVDEAKKKGLIKVTEKERDVLPEKWER